MAEEDVVSLADHTVLDELEDEDIKEVYAGGTLLSQSDESSRIRKLSLIDSLVRQAIDREREYYDNMAKQAIRVNTNMSGECQFRRYGLSTGQTAVMIVKEKRERGNVFITLLTPASTPAFVSIGKHAGIMLNGLDTITLTNDAVALRNRVIRTRTELWAIADIDCVIDVQEEFD